MSTTTVPTASGRPSDARCQYPNHSNGKVTAENASHLAEPAHTNHADPPPLFAPQQFHRARVASCDARAYTLRGVDQSDLDTDECQRLRFSASCLAYIAWTRRSCSASRAARIKRGALVAARNRQSFGFRVHM